MPTFILGLGGHAAALRWLYPDATMVGEGREPDFPELRQRATRVVVGWLGQSPEALEARARKVGRLVAEGINIDSNPVVMPGATVDPTADLHPLACVNQGAVVTHDCIVGYGAHIGPGAVLCGGAKVGAYSMVGAGAVVLPRAVIPARSLVRAGTRYPR